jgi:hypothetical protein
MTNEKPISLGEDDLKLMKELGVAADPEDNGPQEWPRPLLRGSDAS